MYEVEYIKEGKHMVQKFFSPWFLNQFVRKAKKDRSIVLLAWDTFE